jgi:hypothetical protein
VRGRAPANEASFFDEAGVLGRGAIEFKLVERGDLLPGAGDLLQGDLLLPADSEEELISFKMYPNSVFLQRRHSPEFVVTAAAADFPPIRLGGVNAEETSFRRMESLLAPPPELLAMRLGVVSSELERERGFFLLFSSLMRVLGGDLGGVMPAIRQISHNNTAEGRCERREEEGGAGVFFLGGDTFVAIEDWGDGWGGEVIPIRVCRGSTWSICGGRTIIRSKHAVRLYILQVNNPLQATKREEGGGEILQVPGW